MARPRSQKVTEVKQKMIQRIEHGYYQPGSRFLSNRAIGQRFDISYQTADKLVRELVEEGYLFRRPGSGTYLNGKVLHWRGAELIFNERAQRDGSFGALMRGRLLEGFEKAGIDTCTRWGGSVNRVGQATIPIFWECAHLLSLVEQTDRYSLLINQAPPKGLSAAYCDAVSVDDHSGGIAAAQLVKARVPRGPYYVLGGPETDQRCIDRVKGFLEVLPEAKVVFAPSWFYEDGLKAARPVVLKQPEAVFCANDRLAQALLAVAKERHQSPPRVIGFDDAPIAEQLNLTTIAIPWQELASNVVEVVQKRINGDSSTASTRILAPRPVVRTSL